jgi:hypothetical protein
MTEPFDHDELEDETVHAVLAAAVASRFEQLGGDRIQRVFVFTAVCQIMDAINTPDFKLADLDTAAG